MANSIVSHGCLHMMDMHIPGLELIRMMQSQCLKVDDFMASEADAQDSSDLDADLCDSLALDEDPYDPSKPEYIVPATDEEVEQANAALLAKQIAKLEAHIARRSEVKVIVHYLSVLRTLRNRERATGGSSDAQMAHRRSRSQPILCQTEDTSRRVRWRAVTASFAEFDDESGDVHEDAGDNTRLVPHASLPGVDDLWSCPAQWNTSRIDEDAAAPSKRLVAMSFELAFL